MRKLAQAVFAAALIAGAATPAAAGRQDFVVRNLSDSVISRIYVSPVKSGSWEENILGRDRLYPGEEVSIDMQGYTRKQCRFDIKAVSTDRQQVIFENVNLCEVGTVDIE